MELSLRKFILEIVNILSLFLDLLFQPTCLICNLRSFRSVLCGRCFICTPVGCIVCETCGLALSHSVKRCGECVQRNRKYLMNVRTVYWLSGEMQVLLHAIKYQRKYKLFDKFNLDSDFFLAETDFTLVPVPMIFSKLADRGFNQSEFLATLLSEKWNLKVERKGLLKMKNTTSQTKLTEKERLFNLRGAFKWNENTALPKKIILIDDVYTTGSTLEECAKVLVERGAEKVVAWTLFRTPKIY